MNHLDENYVEENFLDRYSRTITLQELQDHPKWAETQRRESKYKNSVVPAAWHLAKTLWAIFLWTDLRICKLIYRLSALDVDTNLLPDFRGLQCESIHPIVADY